MTILRVVDCLALSIAPYIIYYYATELSEYEALKSAGYGSLASVVTALVRGILTALYTPAGSSSVSLRAAIAAAIRLTDVVGLWYALSKLPHRNISNSHKFQAVAVGWALAGAVLFHAAPILAGGFSTEFDPVLVLKAVQANVLLAHTLSMACVGAVLWSKKAKPAGLLPVLRLLIIAHAVVPAVLGVLDDMQAVVPSQALVLHMAATGILAAAAYTVWQQTNTKAS